MCSGDEMITRSCKDDNRGRRYLWTTRIWAPLHDAIVGTHGRKRSDRCTTTQPGASNARIIAAFADGTAQLITFLCDAALSKGCKQYAACAAPILDDMRPLWRPHLGVLFTRGCEYWRDKGRKTEQHAT
jgi:hypothetical protein